MVTRRLLVEDCYRLHIGSLFKSGRVGAGSSGTWRGQRWQIEGAFLVMQDKRWKLVPAQQKNVRGTQWYVQSSKDGRRYRHLLMTPDAAVGTRGELTGIRYRSETVWTGKRLAHRRHKVIERLAGPTSFDWIREHPMYVPDRPKRMRRTTYRRLRKRLTTTPRKQPELDELTSVMGRLLG
jgi:hypothetical protein